MSKLVSTSTETLDETLFRSKAWCYEQLEEWFDGFSPYDSVQVKLHPVIKHISKLSTIDLETFWKDVRIKGQSQGTALSEFNIRNENATRPAVSEISVCVWDERCSDEFLDTIRDSGGEDVRFSWSYQDVGDIVFTITNKDDKPITVEQLLSKFCQLAAKDVGWGLSDFGEIAEWLPHALFQGCWGEQSLDYNCLTLAFPEWTFST